MYEFNTGYLDHNNSQFMLNRYSAPLIQQALRWFRKEHKIYCEIPVHSSQLNSHIGFDYYIWDSITKEEYNSTPRTCPVGESTYDTYELAEIAAIEKMIEIVKTRTNGNKL